MHKTAHLRLVTDSIHVCHLHPSVARQLQVTVHMHFYLQVPRDRAFGVDVALHIYFVVCRTFAHIADMPSGILRLLLAVAWYQICVRGFTDIVLFGDSLSDDCTHGASSTVDEALNTDQVPLSKA